MPEETKKKINPWNGNGRRWFDASKMIWGLFGLVGVLVGLWITSEHASIKGDVAENRIDIKRVETLMTEQRIQLNRIEGKIDNR